METKNCTECLEPIKIEAKKCPNCQAYQSKFAQFSRSQLGGGLITMTVILGFYFWVSSFIIKNDAIYNPKEVLVISDSSFLFKEGSCSSKVSVIGTIKNTTEQPLTDIVFDVEFFDKEGNTIDIINDKTYDLVIAAGEEKKFKVSGSTSSNQDLYISHKITISKVEPDHWF